MPTLVCDPRSIEWKINLFRERFGVGLTHVYGTYDPATGKSWVVKKKVEERVFKDHMLGKFPYGIFPLTGERTRLAVADFDSPDANLPLAFLGACKRYGLDAYIESSKCKGYHAWMFFDNEGVLAVKVRVVLRHILQEAECGAVEIFPKQDRIDVHTGQYGNFSNVPFWGRLVHSGKTVFLDPGNMAPYANQWSVLEHVSMMNESQLDEVIELNELNVTSAKTSGASDRTIGKWEAVRGLPPCAQRMFTEGVAHFQRLSCFRLAIHMKQLGFPREIALAALLEWRGKNHPSPEKQVITPVEVDAQIASAYNKTYQGYGCHEPEVSPYCCPSCHLYPIVETQRRAKRLD